MQHSTRGLGGLLSRAAHDIYSLRDAGVCEFLFIYRIHQLACAVPLISLE